MNIPSFSYFCILQYLKYDKMGKIDLKNKVVVIAGGAKNLGGLISREIAKRGSKIVVHYNSDSTKSDAEETVKAVKDAGGDAHSIHRRPNKGRKRSKTI